PTTAEMEAPGAPISGLMRLKLTSGPRAEVLAMLPAREIALLSEMLAVTAAPELSAPFSTLAVVCVTTSEGLQVPLGLAGHWPPLEKDTASPGATSPTMMPIAPAALSRATFSLMLHVP